jgi:uncharacterized protein (TIRG00374 family)
MDIKVKKRLLWAILFSIGFTVFLLLRIDWNHFSVIAGRLDIKYLIAAYCMFLFGNLIRTFRFIQLDHTDKKLSHWWNINAFYNFITSTLPGGTGEAATAYVLKRFSKFNILGALRILLLSRLMDMFALSALFFIAAIMMHSDTSYREAAIWLSGTLFLISSITLLRSCEQFVMRLLQKLSGHSTLIKRVCEKLSELLIISEEQRSNNSYTIVLFQSVMMMIAGITSIHLALRAFGVDFTFIQSLYCYGIYAVFQIIPVQGIAGLGTQAAWWALALNAAGYKSSDVIAMGFVLYGIFYFIVTVIGLFSMSFCLNKKR